MPVLLACSLETLFLMRNRSLDLVSFHCRRLQLLCLGELGLRLLRAVAQCRFEGFAQERRNLMRSIFRLFLYSEASGFSSETFPPQHGCSLCR
jgi:hypothetical protein